MSRDGEFFHSFSINKLLLDTLNIYLATASVRDFGSKWGWTNNAASVVDKGKN